MNAVVIPRQDDLEKFLDFLYDGLEGYAYMVAKQPDDPDSWDQAFFEWPAQRSMMIRAVSEFSRTQEIYLAPAIFKNKNAEVSSVKASNVLWTDFDGNTPESFDIPPSLIIRSSEPGHEHIYWKLDEPITDVTALQDYNRRICYKYRADLSSWDANQVLRPPYTTNHKRGGLPVGILEYDPELTVHLTNFDQLAPAPEKTVDYSLWEKLDLPNLNTIIYSYALGPDFSMIFEKTKDEVHDRSQTLSNMAYICAERGMSNKEIYVVISHLAERWEKFKHHTPSSRARQLISLIEHVRIKHPEGVYDDHNAIMAFKPDELYNAEFHIDWIIPGMLPRPGILIMAGPSGIGKTRLSLQFMYHMAMGKDYLGYKMPPEGKKVGFFSLEMGKHALKHFHDVMYKNFLEDPKYTAEEVSRLNKNLDLIPVGDIIALNTVQGQDKLVKWIEEMEWEGVFIDSVGSSILGNISSQEVVQSFTRWNIKIINRYNCFLWYIHHFRKPAPGAKPTGDQADLFGDQYINSHADSVYTVTRMQGDYIRVKNPKNRHSIEEEDFKIRLGEGSQFTHHGAIKEANEPINNNNLKKQLLDVIDPTSNNADLMPFNPFVKDGNDDQTNDSQPPS